MYKNIFIFAVFFLTSISYAQKTQDKFDFKLHNLRLEARVDFEYKAYNDTTPANAGFAGKYMNFVLDGQLTERCFFHYRQRLNIANASFSSFFRGCDWLYLEYFFGKHFSVSAGKQVVAIGGFEYDFAPIDVFFWSNFWENVVCYEMGASISYHNLKKNHTLTFQACNSPFVSRAFENLFAYNLIWYGNMKFFHTIYSLNMIEYEKGKFINYISLGNRFDIKDFSFYIDFQNRATDKQVFLFKDFTIVGQAEYNFKQKGFLYLKGGYDVNKAQPKTTPYAEAFDRFVLLGVDYFYYGIGGGFYPLKERKDIRLHAFFAVNHTDNISYQSNLGLTWKMDFLSLRKRKAENKDNNIDSSIE